MSVLFLQLINLEAQEIIGTYKHKELYNSPLEKEVEEKSKELIPNIKPENKSLNKHINFKNDSNNSIEIYYSLTNSNILYLSFIKLTEESSKTFKDNFIYELLEDIDSQNIIKFVDENKKLTNVGLQNLRIRIDKYHNTYNYESGEITNENDYENEKLNVINSHINDIQNDMKENVKNMINNMQDINEIEGKSLNIKDSSVQFKKGANILKKKMENENYRNKVVTFISVTFFITIIVYILIK